MNVWVIFQAYESGCDGVFGSKASAEAHRLELLKDRRFGRPEETYIEEMEVQQ